MNKIRPVTCLFMLVLACAALFAACASVNKGETDKRIESSAKESYAFKTYLQNKDITVKSEDGKVTLTGTVSDESERILAQDTVQNLPGVTSVDNRLKVQQGPAADNSDSALAARVKAALVVQQNVKAGNTDVTVRNGIVTLRGEAENEAQRELTAEYAKDVSGVRGVVNEMTVKGGSGTGRQTIGQRVDDASITAQVMLALMSRRSTRTVDAIVDTTNGIVTVRGTAKNASEKDLVTKIITDVQGVRGVDNKMSVAGY